MFFSGVREVPLEQAILQSTKDPWFNSLQRIFEGTGIESPGSVQLGTQQLQLFGLLLVRQGESIEASRSWTLFPSNLFLFWVDKG